MQQGQDAGPPAAVYAPASDTWVRDGYQPAGSLLQCVGCNALDTRDCTDVVVHSQRDLLVTSILQLNATEMLLGHDEKNM